MDIAAPPPFGLRAYRAATDLAAPLADALLARRLRAGKEDPDRIDERRGVASAPRPPGGLVWAHGASVGESLSVIPLVERLADRRPDLGFLVTTGTVTSARLMADRLPPTAVHQFAPVDRPAYVRRFIDHWRPDAAVFVESEFWPNLILDARRRCAAMVLVNGRVSPRSFESWRRRPKSVRYLLSAFDVLIGQDRQNAERISTLAGRPAETFGNLKNAAAPLPADPEAVRRLETEIGGRPVWLAASTHPGEEEPVLDAHLILRDEFPDLLTVIAPRHPERGDAVRTLAQSCGLNALRRSRGGAITADAAVYVADTLGELGLFYRLSPAAYVGGGLVPKGGHNPLEPARLACAVLHGPHVFNFAETYQELRSGGGAALVRNERELAAAVRRLIGDAKTRAAMTEAARIAAVSSAERVLSHVSDAVLARLPTPPATATATEAPGTGPDALRAPA